MTGGQGPWRRRGLSSPDKPNSHHHLHHPNPNQGPAPNASSFHNRPSATRQSTTQAPASRHGSNQPPGSTPNPSSPSSMTTYQQQYPPQSSGGGRLQQRQSGDFRLLAGSSANGNGPLPVPAGPQNRGNSSAAAGMRSGGPFEGARSPPNKNTSHVPCKFFRQGACQAGKACPFSHSTDPTAEIAPCKYFQKGNCKFGQKCALAHILPDGRRVNKPGFGVGGGHLNLGGRVNLMHGAEHPQQSSLLSMQAHNQTTSYPYQGNDEFYAGHSGRPNYEGIPTIDATFSSHPGSAYGSPPGDGRHAMSPGQKGISLLDAPLPASFDSQGISHMARYGPVAASVPSRFGLESSSPSSLSGRHGPESSALRNLHSSAFGDDIRNNRNGFPSTSPPGNVVADELASRRVMHSDRISRQRMMSSSVGARPPGLGDEWDEFAFEEDLVPTALHDLLTPQERARRLSRSAADEENPWTQNQLHQTQNHRLSLSGLGTPLDSSSKGGSPKLASPGTSAPSRFGPLFNRSAARTSTPNDGSEPSSLTNHGSAFGHVGSPLRNSSLQPEGYTTSTRPTAVSRTSSSEISPFVSSPTRSGSMSMLSQQLHRTHLASRAAEVAESGVTSAPLQHPGISRVASGGSVGSVVGTTPPGRLDRAVSSGSIGRERITEEQDQEGLFDMEDEESFEKRASKRYSGSWLFGLGNGRGSPSIGSRLSGSGSAGDRP